MKKLVIGVFICAIGLTVSAENSWTAITCERQDKSGFEAATLEISSMTSDPDEPEFKKGSMTLLSVPHDLNIKTDTGDVVLTLKSADTELYISGNSGVGYISNNLKNENETIIIFCELK